MSAVLWVRRREPVGVAVVPTVAMRFEDEGCLDVIAVVLARDFLGWPQDAEGRDEEGRGVPHVMGADGPVALKLGHWVVMAGSWWEVIDPVTFRRQFAVLEDLTQVLDRLTTHPGSAGGRGHPAVGA